MIYSNTGLKGFSDSMKIYGYNHYQNLAAKRDRLREQYAQKEEKIAEKYNPLIFKAQKKMKNFVYYWLYSLVGLLVIFLLLFDEINSLAIKIILIALFLGTFVLLGFAIKFRYKWDAIVNEFNQASLANQTLKEEVIKLNQELARLALAIISYSEYHDELSIINDSEKKKAYFQEIYYTYYEAIDKLHNYHATTEDILNYFFQWQNDLL